MARGNPGLSVGFRLSALADLRGASRRSAGFVGRIERSEIRRGGKKGQAGKKGKKGLPSDFAGAELGTDSVD